ncbi:hypothetical protein [Streptomyces sp. CB01881]|uniref:hypothetical protein n=1 Tax=Streptomyces sp. CB01881 TaxID=2078691 RepID=UPI000CDC97C8|nr:hypothetical protein [Streptomyces sp. CB01881]AUY53030.1 hypothetical protein C2142_33565 [Streptomyces sp. CB01881]TYC70745.1 hypothetical protein EH183_33625 [Streptomyces sp. CB01881]
MRKIATAAAAGLLSLGAVGAGAGVASAGSWGGYDTRDGGVALRTCANTSCTLQGRGYSDQSAWIYCFVTGQNINGNTGWSYKDHYLANGSYWATNYSANSYMWAYNTTYHC